MPSLFPAPVVGEESAKGTEDGDTRAPPNLSAVLVSHTIVGFFDKVKLALLGAQGIVAAGYADDLPGLQDWGLHLAIPILIFFGFDVIMALCLLCSLLLTESMLSKIDNYLASFNVFGQKDRMAREKKDLPPQQNFVIALLGATRRNAELTLHQHNGFVILVAQIFSAITIIIAAVLFLLHAEHKFSRAEGFGYLPLALLLFSGQIIILVVYFITAFVLAFKYVWMKCGKRRGYEAG